jgi:hypothetical protein
LGEERERGTREAATFVLKVDGGVEQMRGGGLGWHHAARRWGRGLGASMAVGRQRPEAGMHGRRGGHACARGAFGTG